MKVIGVIGGGLSGLVTVRHLLASLADKEVSIVVLEGRR